MEFDVSGIESETRSGKEFDFLSQNNEPIISFSPDRCRFDRINSRSSSLDISEFVSAAAPLQPPALSSPSTLHDMTNSTETTQTLTQPQNSSGVGESPRKQHSSNNCHQQNQSELQRRLEKRIAQASTTTTTATSGGNCKPNLHPTSNSNSSSSYHYPRHEYDNQSLGRIASVMLNDSGVESTFSTSTCTSGPNPIVKATNSNSMMSALTSSGFDMRKVPSLLPPQRLAIPHKSNMNTTSSTSTTTANPKPHSQEKKPLVQWDSEESEEELSFFPAPKLRSTLTDNLSIDNMSLSGEEDDLHLSPPRSMSNRCPCDPRLLMDSASKSRRYKKCTIT